MLEEYAYDVFGKPYSKQEDGKITNLKKSPIGNTRLYTGREYDRGLKLYYNRARYYNPELGRFISRDPIDISDDVNLYAYVGNNSIGFVDRMGLSKEFIAAHDATELLLTYMEEGRNEFSLNGMLPKFGPSYINYFLYSTNINNGNIKYNNDFIDIAFDPNNNNESCSGYKNGAGACQVYIEGQKVELSEIGNFLVGYNGIYAGMTLNSSSKNDYDLTDIYNAGMFIERYGVRDGENGITSYEDALSDELYDRPWYDAGYYLGKNEIRGNWGLNNNEKFGLRESINLGINNRIGN